MNVSFLLRLCTYIDCDGKGDKEVERVGRASSKEERMLEIRGTIQFGKSPERD